MNQFRVRNKVWIEVDGKPFLGDGRYRLLSTIDRTGSISAAARELGISYRKVWSQLQAMESTAPFTLMERRIGGKNGGSTQLTPKTRQLMVKFKQLQSNLRVEVDKHFSACFCDDIRDIKNHDDSK